MAIFAAVCMLIAFWMGRISKAEQFETLNLKHPNKNVSPKFGADEEYFLTHVKTAEGIAPALFTRNQIEIALDRAAKNPEDTK
jgi:hypothetical protein